MNASSVPPSFPDIHPSPVPAARPRQFRPAPFTPPGDRAEARGASSTAENSTEAGKRLHGFLSQHHIHQCGVK